jgi:hypothetical protein
MALLVPVFWLLHEDRSRSGEGAAIDQGVVYKDIVRTLPTTGGRARSARLELDYWYHNRGLTSQVPAHRKSVKTKDGVMAEVILLQAPSHTMPGTDFSMAFLLVEKKVIDWASCWSSNRTATQDIQLEDVDKDGFLDLAFRAGEGWFGLLDKRRQTRPGDERTWLYAYAITSKGFQTLFPTTTRLFRLTVEYDLADQPITLRVDGVPKRVREYEMFECTVSAVNTSKQMLPLPPDRWFTLNTVSSGVLMTFDRAHHPSALKPGEQVSQTIRILLKGGENEVTLRCRFMTK